MKALSPLPVQALAERLRDAYVDLGHSGEGALPRLAELYDRDVLFRDPLQTLHGIDAFMAMNRRILRRARSIAVDVEDTLGGESSLFLMWTMTYQPRLGRRIVMRGTSHCRVRAGLITEHRDYWDLLSSVAESYPVLRRIYGALAPTLA